MMQRSQSTSRPRLACEVSATQVLAAACAEHGSCLAAHTARTLPQGALTPSLTNPNVADPAALSTAISGALGALGSRSRDVIAVLPDAAMRIVLLDFDSLPDEPNEAQGVIRFRLRKTLPFDVDKASISFQASQSGTAVKVLAAVMLSSTLQEYEAAFLQAGYDPGFVLPSTLASLGTVDAGRPTLVVKVNAAMTSLAIVDQQELRLFRTLDFNLAQHFDASRLSDEIYPSLVFFEDQFGSSIERILVGGEVAARDLASALQTHSSASVEDLVPARYISGGLASNAVASGPLAGVVGALLD